MGVTDRLEKIMENIMDKIGGALGGGKIQPVEIARKAVQELKKNQTVSVSQTYVPNVYEVLLCKKDREELLLYKDVIIPEIKEYLINYIQKEKLTLLGELEVDFTENEDIEPGKFEVKSQIKKGRKPEAVLEKTMVRIPIIKNMKIIVKEGPEKGNSYTLTEGKNLIGRKDDNQIKISDPEISRIHSMIEIIDKEVYLEDMGSTNGTYLNDREIKERISIKNGDIISIGNSILELFSEEGQKV